MIEQNTISKLHKNNMCNKPFINYKDKKQIFIDKLSCKKIDYTKKTSLSTSYAFKNKSTTISSVKPLFSYKDILNKIYSKIHYSLHSYNINNTKFNLNVINNIIFNSNKRIVSIFKDYLLWDETSDFFIQFYNKSFSMKLLPKIAMYYEAYTNFYPEYGPLEDLLKIMKKNIKRKKKYMKMLQEKEDNKNEKNENEEKFERIIKCSDLKISVSKNNSKNSISNKCSIKKNNSNSSIALSSFENDLYFNNYLEDKNDFDSILKTFIDCDDKPFNKIKCFPNETSLEHNKIKTDNLNNIIIDRKKLNEYIQKKNNKIIQKGKVKKNILKKNEKNKNIKKIAQNFNLLNCKEYQKRLKTNESLGKKSFIREKIFKRISLKKRLKNPLLNIINQTSKIVNSKSKENNSYSINKKNNTIKYCKKNIWINSRPHNIKRLFHSDNKLDDNLIENYFSILKNKRTRLSISRKNSHCLNNNSPINLRFNNQNIYTNYTKNKSKNNKNLNYKIKKITKYQNKNVNILLKYNRVSSNIIKKINLLKKNSNKKINLLINNKDKTFYKKSIENLNKNSLTNPFREENYNSFLSNSKNPNITISNSSKNNLSLTKNSTIINYKSQKNNNKGVSFETNKYIKKDSRKILNMKNPNLILMKSNINFSNKNITSNNSSEKQNKIVLSENSSFTKINLKRNNNKNSFTINLNSKNNILKKIIDKLTPKNDLSFKLKYKNNNNSFKKTYHNNIHNSKKLNSLKLEEIDKIKILKINSSHRISPTNANIYLLTKKCLRKDLGINKNVNQNEKIFIKVPLTSRIKGK